LSHVPPRGTLDLAPVPAQDGPDVEEALVAKDDKDATAPAGPSDDAKARFREALERKKAANHRTSQGTGNTGTVQGSETTGPAQRTFRRRSGSA
jgi:Family of unknown function (DUF5302)